MYMQYLFVSFAWDGFDCIVRRFHRAQTRQARTTGADNGRVRRARRAATRSSAQRQGLPACADGREFGWLLRDVEARPPSQSAAVP
jgi:hypothetical protein